jgi:hypothetical protein
MPLGLAKSVYQGYAVAAGSSGRSQVGLTIYGDPQFDRDTYYFDRSSGHFDGTADSIKTTDTLELSAGEWTFECYARATSYPTSAPLIFDPRGTSGALFRLIGVRTVSGNYKIGYYTNTWNVGSTTLATNTWYHLAWVYDGTNVKMYVNGSLEATVSESGTFVDTVISIASYQQSNYYWNGYLDDIRVSNVARYTAAFTPHTTPHVNDADTVLLLHCDGFEGEDDFRDDTGSRTYVTPDRLYVGNSIAGEYDTAQKKFGSSSWYNKDEYTALQMHNEAYWSDSVGTGEFTVEMWVRRQTKSDNTDYYLVDAHNQFDLYYDISANSLKFATEGVDRITGGSLNTNTWYHIAVTRDSSNNTKLFINGTQSGSTSTANDRNWINIIEWSLFGSNSGYEAFVGHIDELRISDVARYTSNFTAPSSAFTNDTDTLLLYHFEGTDATSTSIIDDNA